MTTGSNDQRDATRCFGTGSPIYEAYHDEEWGVPIHDDRHLFELLILEGAQAGLSWETILKRRATYRIAFDNFDIEKVASYGPRKDREPAPGRRHHPKPAQGQCSSEKRSRSP